MHSVILEHRAVTLSIKAGKSERREALLRPMGCRTTDRENLSIIVHMLPAGTRDLSVVRGPLVFDINNHLRCSQNFGLQSGTFREAVETEQKGICQPVDISMASLSRTFPTISANTPIKQAAPSARCKGSSTRTYPKDWIFLLV